MFQSGYDARERVGGCGAGVRGADGGRGGRGGRGAAAARAGRGRRAPALAPVRAPRAARVHAALPQPNPLVVLHKRIQSSHLWLS